MSEMVAGRFLALHRPVHLDLARQIGAMDADAGAVLLSAGLALTLGMLHALTPGHRWCLRTRRVLETSARGSS